LAILFCEISLIFNSNIMNRVFLVASSYLLAAAMWSQPSLDLLKNNDDVQDTNSPEGTWRGRSICISQSSGCHDEEVVYRITRDKGSNSYHVDADKIVNGEAINMGPLVFSFDQTKGILSNETGKNSWRFNISSDRMEGSLMRDHEALRKITLVKVK
jgi:hypothetical protein